MPNEQSQRDIDDLKIRIDADEDDIRTVETRVEKMKKLLTELNNNSKNHTLQISWLTEKVKSLLKKEKERTVKLMREEQDMVDSIMNSTANSEMMKEHNYQKYLNKMDKKERMVREYS